MAAGSVTFPPPDRSGAVPPVGHAQSLLALSQRQPPGSLTGSRRWHPGCRRCLLKGCESWFLPQRPQARYCSPACQHAARRWRRWHASQRYRATTQGKQRRRDQAQRYRSRRQQRSTGPEPAPPPPQVEPEPPGVEAEPPPIDRPDRPRPRPPARASARRNSGKFLGPALRSPRLLRRIPPRACVPRRALLFLLLSPGVTTRPTAGSPAPPPSAARWPAITPQSSRTAGHYSIHVVTYLDFPSLTTIVSLPPKTEEGAGGPGAPVPRFLSRQGGPCDEATHGRLACW